MVVATTLPATEIPEKSWEYVKLDDEHIELRVEDASRGASVIDRSTAGDIVIPSAIRTMRVVSIGLNAFSNCTSITSITIPEGVTNISNTAFYNCTSLTNVVIPSTVHSIGGSAFDNCSRLQNLALNISGALQIGSFAFSGCGSASNVTINTTGALQIGSYAFSGCGSASNVTINTTGDLQLGSHAFYSCLRLHDFTLNVSGALLIGDWAFCNCDGLVDATVMTSNTLEICYRAFYGDDGLTNILFSTTANATVSSNAFESCTSLKDVTLPEGLTYIGTNAFTSCTSLSSIAFSSNLNTIAYQAFDGCTGLNSVGLPIGLSNIEDQAFYGCTNLSSLTVPQSVSSIGARAFEQCSSLTSVSFAEIATNRAYVTSVSIGERAFYQCSSLESVNLPSRVSSIGSRAFADCEGLVSVYLPSNLTEIAERLFDSDEKLTKMDIPASVRTIGASAFQNCTSYADFTIPTNHTVSIGTKAFYQTKYWNDYPDNQIVYDHTYTYILGTKGNPTEIVIPNNCTEISASMFEGMSNLVSITGLEHVTKIGARAFLGTRITNAVISKASSIGSSAFESCASLVSVTLSTSLTSIPDSAFKDCVLLRRVTGTDSVEEVGSFAFSGCVSLQSITFNSGVEYGEHAFQYCALTENVLFPSSGTLKDEYPAVYDKITSLIFPSDMTNIAANACSGATLLSAISIPSTVTSIGTNAFSGCANLMSVTYPANVPLSELVPDTYNVLTNVSISSGTTEICSGAFSNCTSVSSIDIPYTVTSIGDHAFYGCYRLGDSLIIPENVTSIGDKAFAYCTRLTRVKYLGDCPSVASNIYFGTSQSLITAAIRTTSGWTVTSTSSDTNSVSTTALPLRWPTKGTLYGREIGWWANPPIVQIKYECLGGSGVTNYVYSYSLPGRTITLEEPEREGYTFGGWYTAPYGGTLVGEAGDEVSITTKTTLYAKWIKDGSSSEDDDSEDDESDSEYDFTKANTFYGYLIEDESPVGIVTVQIAKGKYSKSDEETYSTCKITMQKLGASKTTLSGTFHEDLTGEVAKGDVSGSFEYSDGIIGGEIDGVEFVAYYNAFSLSKSTEAYYAARDLVTKLNNSTLIMALTGGDDYSYSGYSALSITVNASGKANVKGVLPDGTKVATSGQLLVNYIGEDEYIAYLPIVAQLYSGKKGGISAILSIDQDGEITAAAGKWLGAAGTEVGTLSVETVGSAGSLASGEHSLSADISSLEPSGWTVDSSFSPDGTVITVSGSKWKLPSADKVKFVKGDGYEVTADNGNPAALKLKFTAKTGAFSGSFTLYGETEKGTAKKSTLTINGAVVDGIGYGNAFLKKVGGITVIIE